MWVQEVKLNPGEDSRLAFDTVTNGLTNTNGTIQNYINNSYQELQQNLGGVSSSFANNIASGYNALSSKTAINNAQRLVKEVGVELGDDEINYTPDPRQANLVMRDIVLQHPQVYELYKLDVIDGYDNVNTVSKESSLPPSDIYDAVNPIGVEEDGDYYVFSETFTCGDELDGYSEEEIEDIKDTLDRAGEMVNNNIDPTSKYDKNIY